MSLTTRSLVFCCVLFLFLAIVGVGIWLVLEFLIWDDNDSGPSGIVTPPDAGPQFGETPPPLAPTSAPTDSDETRQQLIETLSPYLPDGGENFADSESPQSQAVDWMSEDDQVYTYDGEKLATRFALATLYYSTKGDSWINNYLWLSDEDECLWFSTSENPCQNGRYVQLRLGDNRLQGSLPDDLSLLSNSLEAMDLGGTLTNKIPWALGELSLMTSLRLRGNELSGTIPASINQLSNLVFLDLRRNKLGGTLSDSFLNAMVALRTLDLSENHFSGLLPSAIGNLDQSLTWLSVGNNRLKGPIPDELSQSTSLTYLNLDSNDFQSLPTSIDELTNLKTLSANNNLFGGKLQESIGTQLTNLEALYLSNNGYTGSIPESFGLLTNLKESLDLSSNQLVGELPESLGQATALKNLNLRNNLLSSTVPLALGALSRLDTLRLDANDFIGELPPAMCDSFNEASSSYYADCRELACPCCNYCCREGECTCRFANSQPILCIP